MEKNDLKISLIISTYNWKEALELVLISLLSQTKKPFEVIIADDGSKEDTKKLIDIYKNKFNYPLRHVWHEDKGFRLAEIRNKAIKKSKGNYIIQTDGDIILHKDYIKDHINNAKPGAFISGSRVLLGKDISKRILKNKSIKVNFFTKDIKNKHYSIRIPLLTKLLRSTTSDIQQVIHSVRGCNMSFWKNDLIQINGYDEDMVGWGREDSEISARLINNGLAKRNLKFSGIQFHIFHTSHTKEGLTLNDTILERTIQEKRRYANNGISKKPKNNTVTRKKITAIIPAYNEEKRIIKALKSVSFAEEIIVVDSFSTDNTLAIAEKYATKIVQHEYENSATQKNWIIPQAKNDWIILLDSDEWLHEDTQKEIIDFIDDPNGNDCFWIYRDNYFMGKRVKYSGWQGDKVIRLFNKECRYENKHVHAEIITENKKVGYLKGHMSHNTFTTIDDYVEKLNRYAKWQAEDYDKKVSIITPVHLLLKPLWRFILHYFLKLGILDGVPGFTISILQAYAVGMRYIKLWLLRRKMM